LLEKIVGDGSVRGVTDAAVLFDRWMLVNKWPLLVRMTSIAEQIDGFFVQVSFGLTMGVVTGRARHFAFENRMVRRQLNLCLNVGMALITGVRLIN
jgi:hypothetical protein